MSYVCKIALFAVCVSLAAPGALYAEGKEEAPKTNKDKKPGKKGDKDPKSPPKDKGESKGW